MRGVFQKRILLSALTGGFFLFAPGAAQSAITGTGTCAGITSPLTADLVCDGDVYVDNGSLLDLGNDVANVTLDVGSGTICIGSDATPPCNTLTGTGTILVDPPGPTGTFGTINAANIVIGAGSALHADGSGCGPSESYDPGLPGCVDQGSGAIPGFGEGADDLASLGGGGGAGYGGPGGAGHANSGSTLNPPGDSYGSTELTTLMAGSGGGNNNDPSFGAPGGAGGGAIHISVSGTLTHNGRISADGSNGSFTGTSYNGGGGSGGSLLISA
ncbi:MAG TPA: hypothetical protein VLB09_03880, partial [Nitrospiria bacterium]|nr:hypothetical protein [Nitrospiria bacterium]